MLIADDLETGPLGNQFVDGAGRQACELRRSEHLRRIAPQHGHVRHHVGVPEQLATVPIEPDEGDRIGIERFPVAARIVRNLTVLEPTKTTEAVEIERHGLGHLHRVSNVAEDHISHPPSQFVRRDAGLQFPVLEAANEPFVPGRLTSLQQTPVIHRRVYPSSQTSRIAFHKHVLSKAARIAAHFMVRVGQRTTAEVLPGTL